MDVRSPADIIADQQTYHMADLQMYRRARRLDERILEALDEAGYEIVRKHDAEQGDGPRMYPLTEQGPDSWERFDKFAELCEHVEHLDESHNMIVSWFFSIPDAGDDWPAEYAALVYMPRLNKTTVLATNDVDRPAIERWIAGYVKARVSRWYGWNSTAGGPTAGDDEGKH